MLNVRRVSAESSIFCGRDILFPFSSSRFFSFSLLTTTGARSSLLVDVVVVVVLDGAVAFFSPPPPPPRIRRWPNAIADHEATREEGEKKNMEGEKKTKKTKKFNFL